jgi:hypothetical protein
MSIRAGMEARIRALIREQRLVGLPRLYRGDKRVRCMLLARGVADAVIGPSGGMPEDERMAQFRGNLDGFSVGELITIARHPFAKPWDADLAPLDPVSSLVWDFRVLDPPNGIRCAGFFAAKDVFVALTWDYREEVEPSDWHDLITECQAMWDDLFPHIAPHYGEFPNAYISKPFHAV